MTAYDDLLHARQRLARSIVDAERPPAGAADEMVRAVEALIDAKLRLHFGAGYARNVPSGPSA